MTQDALRHVGGEQRQKKLRDVVLMYVGRKLRAGVEGYGLRS